MAHPARQPHQNIKPYHQSGIPLVAAWLLTGRHPTRPGGWPAGGAACRTRARRSPAATACFTVRPSAAARLLAPAIRQAANATWGLAAWPDGGAARRRRRPTRAPRRAAARRPRARDWRPQAASRSVRTEECPAPWSAPYNKVCS